MESCMKTTSKTFSKERKDTDNSLGAERDKTNRSLKDARSQVERKADNKVQTARDEADVKESAARTRTDVKFDGLETAKKFILAERTRSDHAIEDERTRVDFEIVREREVKSAIHSKHLEQERELTDRNLATERTSIDSMVEESSERLTAEIADHSKTKYSLTTRDEFLAIVSHDLRNPIGAISSCMEMLLEEIDERKIEPDTRQWLELVKRNADASLRMITDILDMERVVEGKLVVKVRPSNIGPIIQEAMGSFLQAAAAKSVLLRAIPTDVSCAVECDPDRITQIISNLINNALKFTPEQGKIVVKTVYDQHSVTISVCDTGVGIPDNMKGRIFEKFAQIRTTDRTGLGLGLHISKMLVEAHHGTLTVESSMGKGSTFIVNLPLKQPKSSAGLPN